MADTAEIIGDGAPEGAMDNAGEDLVATFVVQNAEYYAREFKRLDDQTGFSISFNRAAAVFGPIWMGARGLWGLFWTFAICELIGLVLTVRGLAGNLGAEEAARAASLFERSRARAAAAQKALDSGADNAAQLQKIAENLLAKAEYSQAMADAIAGTATTYLVVGIGIFLLVKLGEGLIANWALERRYMRWRADRTSSTGLNIPGIVGSTGLVALSYPLTTFRFTALEVPRFVSHFPGIQSWHTNVSKGLDVGFDTVTEVGKPFFFGITVFLRIILDGLELALVGTPWIVVFVVILAISHRLAGARVAIFTAVALAYIGLFGFWEKSMTTVALLGAAAFMCVAMGIPLGIWCGKSQRAYAAVRPILDFMQTMPAFVYLIPVIAFFGVGKPPGVLATMIFGMPPVVRLTALGVRGVPHSVKEAAVAFGASKKFLLLKVELPLALPSIMTGINQTILMCLSMVVIASLIGAKGLGEDVLSALQYAAEGQGMMAGLAILFCAMVLDRIVQGREQDPKRQ